MYICSFSILYNYFVSERVVNNSCYSNVAVMYNPDDTLTWNWRSWKSFLIEHFKALTGIRGYQQFRFSSQEPGYVFAKKSDDETEVKVKLSKDKTVPLIRPDIVDAAGLSLERARYLATHVRQYLRSEKKTKHALYLQQKSSVVSYDEKFQDLNVII